MFYSPLPTWDKLCQMKINIQINFNTKIISCILLFALIKNLLVKHLTSLGYEWICSLYGTLCLFSHDDTQYRHTDNCSHHFFLIIQKSEYTAGMSHLCDIIVV